MKHRAWCLLPFLCCLAALPLLPGSATGAVPGDEHWDYQFGWPGTTNPILAAVLHNGRLYSGGFSGNALLTNAPVEVWDGVQRATLGNCAGSFAVLYDMAFVGDTLYVAGTFTNVNGSGARGLARWDGTNWSSLGLGGYAYALAAEGNNLYVGGAFTNAGSVALTNIGVWDGNAWHGLGDGLGTDRGSVVRALAVTNGTVYAGGLFTNTGPLAVRNLAAWNGATWASVGGGVDNYVYALALNGPDLYAGGVFSQAGTLPANSIAKWDGASWSALGTGLDAGGVNGLAFMDGRLYVAGSFSAAGGIPAANFAIWDGSSWAAAAGGLSGVSYRAIPLPPSQVYVGGNFFLADGAIVDNLALWDGARWRLVGTPGRTGGVNSSVRALSGNGTNLVAGGLFAYANVPNANRIARYDGAGWQAFGPGLNSNVTAVAVVGTNVYAGGDFTGGSGGPLAYHLAQWDGAHWVPLANKAFNSVSRMAVRGDDLFVAGYFTITAADGNASWLARWDGTNFWNVIAFDPDTLWAYYLDGIGFTALAIQDTNIYVSGHFSISQCDPLLSNCTNCDNVMRFDGTYARVMGTGLNTNAVAIAVLGSDVYFGGTFTNAGGLPANQIARWDGQSWSPVGGGVVGRGTVLALAVLGTNLYAGGSFTNMGGVPANHIARWDGSHWSALGSGTAFSASSGSVFCLLPVGSDLYVGGTFFSAGAKPACFLARWNEQNNFYQPQLLYPVRLPGGEFNFHVLGDQQQSYVIQASTNLTSWTPLLTNSAGLLEFTDPSAASFSRRFYRALLAP